MWSRAFDTSKTRDAIEGEAVAHDDDVQRQFCALRASAKRCDGGLKRAAGRGDGRTVVIAIANTIAARLAHNVAARLRFCKTFLTFWFLFIVCVVSLLATVLVEFVRGEGGHYDAGLGMASGDGEADQKRPFFFLRHLAQAN